MSNSAPPPLPLSISQDRVSSRSQVIVPDNSSPDTVRTVPRSGSPPLKSARDSSAEAP